LFPGFRVFVYGREITEDVIGITLNWSSGRSPSTCNIILSNERDKFLMTDDDIVYLTRNSQIVGSKMAANDDIALLLSSYSDPDLDLRVGNASLLDSIRMRMKLGSSNASLSEGPFTYATAQEIVDRLVENTPEFSIVDPDSLKSDIIMDKLQQKTDKGEQTYDIYSGRSIFHAMDPVRVFFKEPDPDLIDPKTGEVVWYYMFAGWVSSISEEYDPGGQKVMTLSCEDVLKNFRYSMLVPNMALFDAPQLQDLVEGTTSWTTSLLAPVSNQNFTDSVLQVVFGNQEKKLKGKKIIDGKTVEVDLLFDGVGRFDSIRTKTFIYPTSGILPDYYRNMTHKVQISDLTTMANSGSNNNRTVTITEAGFSTLSVENIITIIGQDPFDKYPVEGTVKILIPDEERFPLDARVLTAEMNNIVQNQFQFLNKLSLLFAIADRVGFVLYTHPKGDIVLECPLFDFTPLDFGKENLQDLILFDDRCEKVSTVFSDQNLKTVYIADTVQGISAGLTGAGIELGKTPQAEILERLIPQYGIRIERGSMDRALVKPEAALAWAKIALRQMNGNTFTAAPTMALNPRYWLNRPMLWEARSSLGTPQKITHSLSWNGGASTMVGLSNMRGWKGHMVENPEGKEIIPDYEPIGGAQSQPLDYKVLFGGR